MKFKRLKLQVDPKSIKNNDDGLNIFELGTLIQLETHNWQARKRLPDKITKKLTPKSEKNLVRANKDLIDKSHLQEINSIIAEARQYVWDIANPFPIKGIHFVNNDLIPVIKERLDGYRVKLKKAVHTFSKEYSNFISQAEKELGADKLFDPSDYPSKECVCSRFSISYRFFDLSIPKHIDDSLREQEMESFRELMQQTREMGILALREGFADIVTHLTDTLSGKLDGEKKRLHQESIDKVSQFFDTFQQKNIFKDTELENIIKDAMLIIGDVNATELRTDQNLTKVVNEQLERVKKNLDKSITTFKRKVSFT